MKIYFASDVHWGAPAVKDKRRHESIFVEWLDEIKADADEVYLLGDIFDYWYEYSSVVPRGFARFLGKLCELTDKGIKVHIFTGNHDVWMFSYLQEECGVEVHTRPYEFESCGKHFHVGHGDGLGKGEHGYRFMKRVFESRVAQFLYSLLHPTIATWFARTWSRKSRKHNNRNTKMHSYLGDDKEYQVLFAKEQLKKGAQIDYFIFGHRHVVHECDLGTSRVLMIGDWLWNFSYAVFDGNETVIKRKEVNIKLMD